MYTCTGSARIFSRFTRGGTTVRAFRNVVFSTGGSLAACVLTSSRVSQCIVNISGIWGDRFVRISR